MVYLSIDEICKEFELDKNLDVDAMIKELTQMQRNLHPDINGNYTSQDEERFSRITEAKGFLKKYDGTLVPISAINTLMQIMKKENEISKAEKLEADLLQSFKKKLIEVKRSYLPRKISAASVMAVVTFLWAFPTALKDHPIIGQYFISAYDSGYLILTMMWFFLVALSLVVLIVTFLNESRLKHILHDLEDLNTQYKMFSWFIDEIQSNEFKQRDLEAFMLLHILVDKKMSSITSKQIGSVVPQISEMLIARALEKGIVRKIDKVSWYDTYTVAISKSDIDEYRTSIA